jgi:DNA (cytosine-5)-methyltransferase 1
MKNGFDQAYTREILERLSNAGYTVNHAVLNAVDYGIPQRRRRAFFIASDRALLHFPHPTHVENTAATPLLPMPQYVTVWEAIGDLPSVEHGQGDPICDYASPAFSEYQARARVGSRRVTNHQARKLQPTQFERLASIRPGQGIKHLPKHLRPKSGYSGAYGRLTECMIAPTITRWVFHPGSGRWGHPRDVRVLTIREAARIQGFPDWFEFVGTYTQMAGQVGNAVPAFLVQALGEAMCRQLTGLYFANISAKTSMGIFASTGGSANLMA